MAQHHDDINAKFAARHIIPESPDQFALSYDPADVFEKRITMKDVTGNFIGSTGSAIVSGKYNGHGFYLDTNYDWVIREYETWTGFVTKILVPLKKEI